MKKKLLLLLPLIGISAFWSSRPVYSNTPPTIRKANSFNKKGMAFYKQKKYKKAAFMFRKASQVYPGHRYAAYNLACMYALLADTQCGMPVEIIRGWEVSEHKVFEQLKKAIAINPSRRRKAKRDPDFQAFHKRARFLIITSLNPKKPNDVKKLLYTVKNWFSNRCSPGVYGCNQAKFYPDGRFSYSSVFSPCLTSGRCSGPQSTYGRYRIDKNGIRIRLKGKIRYFYFPDKYGRIKEKGGKEVFSDTSNDRCSA